MSTGCEHKYDIRYSIVEGVEVGCTECGKAARTNRRMDGVNSRICTLLVVLGYLVMIWTGIEGLGWQIALMAAWLIGTVLMSSWLEYRYLLHVRKKGVLEKYIRMTDKVYIVDRPAKKGKFGILSALMDEGVEEYDDYNYEEGFDGCGAQDDAAEGLDLFPDYPEGEEQEAPDEIEPEEVDEAAMMKLLERMELFAKEEADDEQPEAAAEEETEPPVPHSHSWHVEYGVLSGLYAECPECGAEGKTISALLWGKHILLAVILLVNAAYLLIEFHASAGLTFQLLFMEWVWLYLLLSWLEYRFLRRAEKKSRLDKYIRLPEEAAA